MERPEYNLLMSTAKYKPGDYVWTNVQTYSPWPGRVCTVSNEILSLYPDRNQILHYVELYVKKERDFLTEDELMPFEEGPAKFSVKRRSIQFHEAVFAAREEMVVERAQLLKIKKREAKRALKNSRRTDVDQVLPLPPSVLSPFSTVSDLPKIQPLSSLLAQSETPSLLESLPSTSQFGRRSTLASSEDVYEFTESEPLDLNMGRRAPKETISGANLRGESSSRDGKPGRKSANLKRKIPSTSTHASGISICDESAPRHIRSLLGYEHAPLGIGCQAKTSKVTKPSEPSGRELRRRTTKKNYKPTFQVMPDEANLNEFMCEEANEIADICNEASSTDEEDMEEEFELSSHMKLSPRMASSESSGGKRIGFLGLGGLGKKIVKNLLTDGHEVTIWNRTPHKCYEMLDLGLDVIAKSTADQVVRACNVTFCCVTDTRAVREVVYSPNGAMKGIRGGKSFAVITTIDPRLSLTIQDDVLQRGGLYLEAPMFPAGGTIVDNDLMTTVGGGQDCLRACIPFFRAFVKDLFYVGPVPEGNEMILLMKSLSGVKIAALAESMALADRCGVPSDILFQIVKQTQLASPFFIAKAETMIGSKAGMEPGSDDDTFPLTHFSNDLTTTLNLTSELDTPVLAAAKQVYLSSKARGYSHHDVSAVYLKFSKP